MTDSKISKKNAISWHLPAIPEEKVKNISRLLGISGTTAKILLNRGYSTLDKAKAFLMPKLDDLRDPSKFKQMATAVKRTWEAIEKNQNITIFGDYDADGVCSTVILLKMFELAGKMVNYEIPTRFKGYGLTKEAIDKMKCDGTNLIITIDCGQTNTDEIKYAAEAGIDTIIIDHHEPATEMPRCTAILNPKIDYDFGGLGSGAISFKFALAVLERKKELLKSNDFIPFALALAAIAAIADVVPLVDENRIIVHYGLLSLTLTNNHGLNAIVKKCGLVHPNPFDISMRLVPFINAAGRISSAKEAVKLFMANDSSEAKMILKNLEQANNQRKRVENTALIKARKRILGKSVLITWAADIPVGVLGIISSRLCREFNKPCIVFTIEGNTAIGSCRSPVDVNILELISKFKDLYINFGGHKMACGIRMLKGNLQKLAEKIEELKITKAEETLTVDAEIQMKDITDSLAKELEFLEPYGPQNPEPLFVMKKVTIHEQADRIIIVKDNASFIATSNCEFTSGEDKDIVFQIKPTKPVSIKLTHVS